MTDESTKAIELIDKKFSLSEAKEILRQDDDITKSAVILNLELVDEDLAKLLIFNLTNQSGPVREVTAFKIDELIRVYTDFFQQKNDLDKFVAAINDVNPNVVRFILQALKFVKNKEYVFYILLKKITLLYDEVIAIPRRGKSQEHIFTKKCFKIYWSLEGIKAVIKCDNEIIKNNEIKEKFFDIINNLSNFEDYTIREKIAQIVKILPFNELSDIKIRLSKDKNYFVKRQCED